jgi:hypothetical protein
VSVVSIPPEDQEIANILVETINLSSDAIEYDDGKIVGLKLAALSFESGIKSLDTQTYLSEGQQAVGPALRAVYNFLREADTAQFWGGLSKVLTPDGNILWLCEVHRKQYEVKRLQLDVE